MNKFHTIGNLGKDVELRRTTNDKVVAKVSLGEDYYDFRAKETKTQWWYLVAFGKTAERLAEYCQKGTRIYVDGRIQQWENDGKRGVDVVVNDWAFAGAKPQPKDDAPRETMRDLVGPGFDDEIPF